MQEHDLPCNPSVEPPVPDPPSSSTTMPSSASPSSSPIHKNPESKSTENHNIAVDNKKDNSKSDKNSSTSNNNNNTIVRRERPSRACTQRAAARLYEAAAAEAALEAAERKKKASARRERLAARLLREEVEEDEENGDEQHEQEEESGAGEDGEESSLSSRQQCSKIVTQLVGEPEPSQLPRWSLRSMWQLASILNFLNVFRPLLNIKVEFSAEELETALITPNNTLGDIHIPLLKAIPPITRMACGHNTWVTVLCRKLRDWWHWVADGELPIVASHGAEVEAYNSLDPGVRVVILKALCDIRVEQEDIRNYIDSSIKHGVHLSTFRKERMGGDSHGISYWYEDDPVIGHRLYREIRKVEVKKSKGKNVPPIPSSSYQWETVATNLDEFQDVSEKLFSSKNRTESSVGKKLRNDMLPEIEKVHKRKERLLKKQHRQALLLDNMVIADGLAAGRSLRDRKPVTYTFDDYDRSINEAIKITKKKQPSPDPFVRRDGFAKNEASANGGWEGPSHYSRQASFNAVSPNSPDYDDYDGSYKSEMLDRSNRRRQRPQRYSAKDFVEAISDNDADFDSDDDIVGEAVYDEEYLRKRKQKRKSSSGSEGDDEYHWDNETAEEEEEEEEDDDDDSLNESDDSEAHRFKKLPGRTRRETKLRSVDELQSGLRRSRRATRNRINYRQYELSESETETVKHEKSNASDEHSDGSGNAEFSAVSQDSEDNIENDEMNIDPPVEEKPQMLKEPQNNLPEKADSPVPSDVEGVGKRRFLDLNELAPGSGFDDGPNSMKDEDADDF